MKRGLLLLLVLLGAGGALAQQARRNAAENALTPTRAGAYPILSVPVSHLRPGQPPPPPQVTNPAGDDPQAAQRGMRYFISFNCVGCHAPNGGGGMGPSLSDVKSIYGAEPANLFLSIYQGRPNGMPAWGGSLPESVIWDLVAYVRSIGQKPDGNFGQTISRTPASPQKQQTPAEFVQTANPWAFTEPFGNGKKPDAK
ncbi:cytochrome c oxidase cbb3-type subunit 3 [Rhodoblastus acidophilus]|uniref:c-type cytochrome n=1 Tax=Rhodoblastus acidophilus TaxID=1074 RepID=UPI002225499E|nr:c-type cytochrome [Rhodoblastus acidophilus]MCW2283991.1 cytochrome c oxidase cbb3-type subunit 3 [Rhodoblastus acidophilus]MCW2332687.1 cytochrome c oxidase cbb3-type subunit 3 [Rhodoblastus acidophilus]